MSQRLVCVLLLSVLLTSALARNLKDSAPGLNIQFPGGSVTGGNGKPLEVVFPGGDVTVDKKDKGCGEGSVVVDVNHPAGTVGVDSGKGCKPTAVDVTAPGTTVAVEKDGKKAPTVDVQAPGTTVAVEKDGKKQATVDVKAPGTVTAVVPVEPQKTG